MPWVTNQSQFRSLIVLNNHKDVSIDVALKAVRPAGADPGEMMTEVVMEPFSQRVVDAGELFEGLGDGQGFTVHISAAHDGVTGAFVVRGTGTASGDSPAQGNMVAKASGSNVIMYDYMTVRKDDDFTGLVAINAGMESAEIRLSAFQNGRRVGTNAAVIEPDHPWVGTTADLFPGVSGEIYAVAESDQPLLGVAFLFNGFLEPSMANARAIEELPQAPEFEATVSTLFGPTAAFDGFVIDAQGTIFGAGGWTQDHVVKIDAQGEVTTIARGLGGPVHIIQDSQENLFVSEFTSHEVARIDKDGGVTTFATGLDAPTSMAFDESGNLWVANYGRTYQGRTISKIAPDGSVTTALNDPLILAPIDIFFHESGDLLIANQVGAKILRATRDGQVTLIDQLPERGIGHMIYVNGVLYATAGNRIYKTTLDGTTTVFAGNGVRGLVDGSASDASFNTPNGIWVMPDKRSLLVNTATRGTNDNYIRQVTLK